MPFNVAIDGPAGAGKSTAARLAAAALGFIYVDTGALYRAVGVHAMRLGADTSDARAVEAVLPSADVSLKFTNGVQRVFLGEEDVSEAIRTPEASMAASDVSAIPAVRGFLFDLQHDIAAANDCIMDGRDIGTVVLPDAQVKIFLTASAEARARRRCDELAAKGTPVRYEDVYNEMVTRDYNDSHRAAAPLRAARDAVLLDTTALTLDESVDAVLNIIRGRL